MNLSPPPDSSTVLHIRIHIQVGVWPFTFSNSSIKGDSGPERCSRTCLEGYVGAEWPCSKAAQSVMKRIWSSGQRRDRF